MSVDSCSSWAQQTFGGAQLGDPRRTRRLVRIAEKLGRRPAGTVTQVFSSSREREGAYRLLENQHFSTEEVLRARDTATVVQCRGEELVYVAIDSSSLSLTDTVGARDVGSVGSWARGGRGLLVTSALAVSTGGIPIGLCGQRYRARKERASTRYKHPQEAVLRELNDAVLLVSELGSRFAAHAQTTRPWFQFDRGYDGHLILRSLRADGHLFTVRAAYNRRLFGEERYLSDALEQASVLGTMQVHLPKQAQASARIAHVSVKTVVVNLRLRLTKKRSEPYPVQVVQVVEMSPPASVQPLEWKLYTSAPLDTFDDVKRVVEAYKARWRIEELHRTWKSGLCNIEDTQLRSRDAIVRWATLSATVAARANRLSMLARESPEELSSTEFSRDEIDATIVLTREDERKAPPLGSDPPLKDLVRWIAELGGYTGKSSGGPPGPIVIGRGLARVEAAALAIKSLRRRDL